MIVSFSGAQAAAEIADCEAEPVPLEAEPAEGEAGPMDTLPEGTGESWRSLARLEDLLKDV